MLIPLVSLREDETFSGDHPAIVCVNAENVPKHLETLCDYTYANPSGSLLALRKSLVAKAVLLYPPDTYVMFQDSDDVSVNLQEHKKYIVSNKYFLRRADLLISPTTYNGAVKSLYEDPLLDLLGRRIHTSALMFRLSWLYHILPFLCQDGMFEYWLLYYTLIRQGIISYSKHSSNLWSGKGRYTRENEEDIGVSKRYLAYRLRLLLEAEQTANPEATNLFLRWWAQDEREEEESTQQIDWS